MLFLNREEAGRILARQLARYRHDPQALILALPRGGVAVGYAVSLMLHLPLDVFITRKLGAPGNPEFAIGALAETGTVYFNPQAGDIVSALRDKPDDLNSIIHEQRLEIARRQSLYRGGRDLPDLTHRTVLLVDDGIATGSTFFATVEGLRQSGLRELVAAIPVGPPETLHQLRQMVDELVVLETPDPFWAVGNHYVDFAQVTDEQVIRYLRLAEEALPHRQGHAHA